jgi:hypothetical protein
MKHKIGFLNIETATAAVDDAKNLGLSANMIQERGEFAVEFESMASYEASRSEPTTENLRSLMSEIDYRFKWMSESISEYRKMYYDHLVGHLPAIKDAGKMKEALKALGLEDSFEVRKPSVTIEW